MGTLLPRQSFLYVHCPYRQHIPMVSRTTSEENKLYCSTERVIHKCPSGINNIMRKVSSQIWELKEDSSKKYIFQRIGSRKRIRFIPIPSQTILLINSTPGSIKDTTLGPMVWLTSYPLATITNFRFPHFLRRVMVFGKGSNEYVQNGNERKEMHTNARVHWLQCLDFALSCLAISL